MNNTDITIDLTYLNSITGGDKSFEQILLISTVSDLDIMVNGLKDSWEKKDAEGIRKNAHSLISLSAIAGMTAVEIWSREIEKAFEDGMFHAELAPMANNIVSGWPSASLQLQELIAGN